MVFPVALGRVTCRGDVGVTRTTANGGCDMISRRNMRLTSQNLLITATTCERTLCALLLALWLLRCLPPQESSLCHFDLKLFVGSARRLISGSPFDWTIELINECAKRLNISQRSFEERCKQGAMCILTGQVYFCISNNIEHLCKWYFSRGVCLSKWYRTINSGHTSLALVEWFTSNVISCFRSGRC